MIDIHQHILPGVDDGARDIKETMEMLKVCEDEGITIVFATPHFSIGKYPATVSEIYSKVKQINEICVKEKLQVRVKPGAEIYWSVGIYDAIRLGIIPTLAGTSYILLEFDLNEAYSQVLSAVRMTIEEGFVPIIAHIERYNWSRKSEKRILELTQAGARIQMNVSSILGSSGFFVVRYCKKLLSQGVVDYIATDAHSTGVRAPLFQKCRQKVADAYGEAYAEVLFETNARKIQEENKKCF